jgi:hypothetical protein
MVSQLSIQKLIKIHSVWTPFFQLHLARYMHKLYFAAKSLFHVTLFLKNTVFENDQHEAPD